MALAAYLGHLGLTYLMLGKPMGFWKEHMPTGMYLRSACDWHLDPTNLHTIEAFLETQGLTPKEVEPLSLDFYLRYAEWFQAQKRLEPIPVHVARLEGLEDGPYRYRATLEDGQPIEAKNVVLALGFKHFEHVPPEAEALLPAGSYTHTCDLMDFSALRGKRCLILGGRQSAFEWAALLCEAGAAAVHLSHRHPSPAFAEADWSWVNPIVDDMAADPGWFRRLSQEEKEALSRRLWAEGRLKVEPWLKPRLGETVRVWPETRLVGCEETPEDARAVALDNGETLEVDQIILATGYKVDLGKLPLLKEGNLLARLETKNGFPVLGEDFQTNLPGLYLTSMAATQDFGPFFAFTISTRTSAKVIGQSILDAERDSSSA